jgi:putative ABC transport system permease protein
MTLIAEWIRRIRHLLNRSRLEATLQQEMDAHREMMRDPAGFGNTLQFRERSRDVWGWAWLDNIARDVRFAIRGLWRTPTFTIVATVSLALGFALSAVTISVVNAYLIRSLPYPDARRLYHVRYAPPGPWEPAGMHALDWTSVADLVEYPIAPSGAGTTFTEGGSALSGRGLRVTYGFVEGLGVRVGVGRRFTEQDFVIGAEGVALIGHGLWRDRFQSDPGVIGRLIRTDPEASSGSPETYRIVGVLTPGFYFGRDSSAKVDLLIPQTTPVRAYMVRLRKDVPPAAAARRMTEAARRAATSPIPADWTGVQLESAHERYVGSLRPVLVGVTVAVSLVLVIVCANVAVLLLLRSMQRRKEVAIRLALGSGRRHIARMLLTETSVLCAAALGLGLSLTAFVLRALAPLIEAQLGRPAPTPSGIVIDSTVVLLVGGISALVALSLSLAPLLTSGNRLANALRQDGRVASDGPSMRRIRSGLIAFEIAGSLVLLVACGLMIRSLVDMMGTDLGFRMDGLVKARVVLQARNYPTAAAYRQFHERFAERVSVMTGSSAVFSSWPPFFAAPAHLIETETPGVSANAGAIAVSAGYFAAFGIGIRQGREFTTDDDAGAGAPVAVISAALAQRLWPDGGALGRRVREVEQTQAGSTPGPWRTVVGIAGDVRQTYEDTNRHDFYTPRMPDGRYGNFYVRTPRPAPLLLETLRAAAAELDREAVVDEPRSVADLDQTLAGTRVMTSLLSGFALIAACLALVGIYGVTAYAFEQRHKEVAIRVALGASERAVQRIFLRHGAVLLGIGTAVGLLGGAAVSRVLRNQIYGVESFDISTYLAPCAILLAFGLAAIWWPVRRAAIGDTVRALNAN